MCVCVYLCVIWLAYIYPKDASTLTTQHNTIYALSYFVVLSLGGEELS